MSISVVDSLSFERKSLKNESADPEGREVNMKKLKKDSSLGYRVAKNDRQR